MLIAVRLLVLFIEFSRHGLSDLLVFRVDVTAPWPSAIAAIASEVELTVQLVYFMAFMAVHHAGKTEPMSINRAGQQLVLL